MANVSRRSIRAIRDLWKTISLDPLPIRHGLSGYGPGSLQKDVTAGLNLTLLAFPQGMAYALIAGLPISYGIYGSAIAAFLCALFSGGRYIVAGPTNATSVLLFASFLTLGIADEQKLALMPLLLLLVGVFLLIGSLLQVANLIQYVSRTVITGYVTAAAIYIILNQIRKALGFSFEIESGSTFFDVVRLTVVNLPQTQWSALILSVVTAATFLLLNRYFRKLPNVALTLVFAAIVGYVLNTIMGQHPEVGQALGGAVGMLPPLGDGGWPVTIPTIRDEDVSLLAPIALVIAFLSVLEGASIGKSLAARRGDRLDTSQEMFGLGVANVGCAFFGGMPASGSLTRSQLNFSSEAATGLSVVFCGLFVAVGAFLIGPFLHYIPSASLAVVVITIGLSLLNFRTIKLVLKATKSDMTVFIVTFLAALLVRLDFAIILGAATSILLFLRKAATPELVEYTFTDEGQLAEVDDEHKPQQPQVSIVHVEGDLFFGAAELFRDQMRRMCMAPSVKVVILKMRNAHHLDATSCMALEELVRFMKDSDRTLLVSEARKDAIRIFRRSGLTDVIGRENIFPDVPSNPTLSTARALKRAMTLMDGQDADVQIFVGKSVGPEEKKELEEKREQEEEQKAKEKPPES